MCCRATPFQHVCELLRNTQEPPKYILLENVLAFILSQSLEEFLAVLAERGFQWQACTPPPVLQSHPLWRTPAPVSLQVTALPLVASFKAASRIS